MASQVVSQIHPCPATLAPRRLPSAPAMLFHDLAETSYEQHVSGGRVRPESRPAGGRSAAAPERDKCRCRRRISSTHQRAADPRATSCEPPVKRWRIGAAPEDQRQRRNGPKVKQRTEILRAMRGGMRGPHVRQIRVRPQAQEGLPARGTSAASSPSCKAEARSISCFSDR